MRREAGVISMEEIVKAIVNGIVAVVKVIVEQLCNEKSGEK